MEGTPRTLIRGVLDAPESVDEPSSRRRRRRRDSNRSTTDESPRNLIRGTINELPSRFSFDGRSDAPPQPRRITDATPRNIIRGFLGAAVERPRSSIIAGALGSMGPSSSFRSLNRPSPSASRTSAVEFELPDLARAAAAPHDDEDLKRELVMNASALSVDRHDRARQKIRDAARVKELTRSTAKAAVDRVGRTRKPSAVGERAKTKRGRRRAKTTGGVADGERDLKISNPHQVLPPSVVKSLFLAFLNPPNSDDDLVRPTPGAIEAVRLATSRFFDLVGSALDRVPDTSVTQRDVRRIMADQTDVVPRDRDGEEDVAALLRSFLSRDDLEELDA